MPMAMRIHAYGGSDQLKWEEVSVGDPGAGEIRVAHEAVGLNYIDVYHRTGLYPVGDLPAIIGTEAAGKVVAVGEGVTHVKAGDRVAYVNPIGAYCEERLMPADRAVKVPDAIDAQTAAAMMLQGLTTRYLLRETYVVGPETTLLFHAAAGGVGLIFCQWAKSLGATVIGTASSDEKIALAKAHGATHMINYRTEDFVERVRELTDGKGCDVVYDAVGKDTFPGSLDCLRPRGLFVSFGNASGPVPPFTMKELGSRGSLIATRPSLFHFVPTYETLEASARDLFDVVADGTVKITVNQTYPLADVARAHDDLEGRRTTGSTVFLV
ncbi:MAG: quinone oxidoreductase [Pseudomonadota bacterium]